MLITLDGVSLFHNTDTKPANVTTWANVYQPNTASSQDNTVARLGGHWGSVTGADSNTPVDTTHAQAGIMFNEVLSAFNKAGYGETAKNGGDWDKGPATKGFDDPEGPFKNCQCKK